MPIDIRIQIDLTPRQRRVMRAAVVAGTVIAALGIGIAIAAPLQTGWIVDGGPVSAPSLMADMTELNRRTIATNGSVGYSVGATVYCGIGPTSTTGAISYNSLTGYAGAKAMCQASTGCGMSPTAHMCTSEEIVRTEALGVDLSAVNGWFSAGIVGNSTSATTSLSQANYWSDCGSSGNEYASWTKTATDQGGSSTLNGPSLVNGTVNVQHCAYSQPVLCCD